MQSSNLLTDGRVDLTEIEPMSIKTRRVALLLTVQELADIAGVSTDEVVAFEQGDDIEAKAKVKILVALGG